MQRKFNYGEERIQKLEDDMAEPTVLINNIDDVIYSVNGKGLGYMGCEDIGKYVIFPVKEYKKVFPVEPFGSYIKDELIKTKIYSVKCREEALRITNLLSYKKLQEQRVNKLSTCFNKNIENPEVFSELYQDIADIVRAEFKAQSTNAFALRMFNVASIFDSIVTLLIHFLRENQKQDTYLSSVLFQSSALEAIANQLISKLAEVCKNKKINKPFNINDILEYIDEIDFQLPSSIAKSKEGHLPKTIRFTLRNYQAFYKYLWRPKMMEDDSFRKYKGFNTGALIHGESGVGKSQIMSFVSLWAHEMGWFVVPIKGANFTVFPKAVEYHYSGLHFDVKSSFDLLKAIHSANIDHLNTFDVDMNVYGKCDLAGSITGDPDFNTRLYNKKRNFWSDDWKLHFPNERLKGYWDEIANSQKKLLEKMPKDPKKLIDIVLPALKEPILCTAAVGEILQQLKGTNKCKSLIAVDDYNEWYLNTQFKSFRYENSKETKYGVPGYDFAIPRMFMRLDSHKMNSIFKLFATSNYRLCHHICTPEKINFPEGYDIKISNMPLDDFRISLKYFTIAGYTKNFKEEEIEKYYMESQGNIRDFHRSFFDTQAEYFAEA
jgi:small subunit ribosomal protein S29